MTLVRLIFISVVLLISTLLSAQEIYFSQLTASPLNLNPALTGVMDGDLRIVLNRRNQWSQVLKSDSYTTTALAIDAKRPLNNKDYLGFGVSGYIDRIGTLPYGSTAGRGSFSYHKNLSRNPARSSYLVMGLEYGLTKQSTNIGKVNWGYPPADPDFECEILYGDLSAGLVWTSVLGQHKSYYGGIAIHHLNQPDISFYSIDTLSENLAVRTTIHGGGEWTVAQRLSIMPSFFYTIQNEKKTFNIGAALRKYLGDKPVRSSLQVGVFYREGTQEIRGRQLDAIIFTTRLNIKDMVTISFAYDKKTADFEQAHTGSGAFECSLGYILDQNRASPKQYPVY